MERPFRAYKGDAPYIFVSYAHNDDDVVYEDIAHLHDQGINIWYDEGIEPGVDWRDELADAVADCALFLFFVSHASIDSVFCRQEVNFALGRERRVLLIYLERTQLPRALEFSLSDRQAIERELYSVDDYHEKIFSAVTERSIQSNWRSSLAKKHSDRSIAILPLLTLGQDDDFLGEGIAAELVTGLAKVRDLQVASRAAAFAQAGARDDLTRVAEALDVRHVLDGTLRRSRSRLRVTTELFDVETGGTLWTERYDRVFDDIFDVQEDIANAVTEALKSEFGIGLGREVVDVGTRDPAAYQAYLQACHSRYRLTPEGIVETADFLREALAADPKFLEAYLLLITMLEGEQMFYGAAVEEEIANLEHRARALDFGQQRVNWYWKERSRSKSSSVYSDPHEDESLFREMIFHADHPAAQGVNPNSWFFAGFTVDDVTDPRKRSIASYALLLAQAGLYQNALAFFRESGCDTFAMGCCMMGLNNYDEARKFLADYGQRRPDVVLSRLGHISALHRLDRPQESAVEAKHIDAMLNDDMREIVQMHSAYYLEDSQLLNELSNRIESYNVPLFFQALITLFTDIDKAVELFRRAYEAGDVVFRSCRLFIPLYLPAAVWRELEQEPRFIELMDKIGIGAEWQTELSQRVELVATRLKIKLPTVTF